MQRLVIALEADCLDANVPILQVLQKALIVARKLSLTDAEGWIEKELKGYKPGDAPPPHRLLTGQIKAWNPYRGWIWPSFADPTTAADLSICFVGQPVAELETLTKGGAGTLEFPFDPLTERKLIEAAGVPLRPTRHLSYAAVGGVVDAVRNMVLDWCLKLEKDGILGEGLVFSAKEKEVAAHSNYTINYNAPVAHSQIQQNSASASQVMSVGHLDKEALVDFVRLLRGNTAGLKLDSLQSDKLEAEIKQVESQMALPKYNNTILNQSLQTIRNVLEGCGGSLIASGLLYELAKVLK